MEESDDVSWLGLASLQTPLLARTCRWRLEMYKWLLIVNVHLGYIHRASSVPPGDTYQSAKSDDDLVISGAPHQRRWYYCYYLARPQQIAIIGTRAIATIRCHSHTFFVELDRRFSY